MTNVKVEVKGKIMTLTVKLDEDHGPSGSGKTQIVATSSGIQPTGFEDVKFGLNVFRPKS